MRGPVQLTEAFRLQVHDSLHVELKVPARARDAEPVRITLEVENRGKEPLDLYLHGRETTFDVEVATVPGKVVWRRLRDAIIPAIVHVRALAPRERFELAVVWDQRDNDDAPVGPGDYNVRAFLLAEGMPFAAAPQTLRISR